MMKELLENKFTHIVCAVGSAGTLAGILMVWQILCEIINFHREEKYST
jgi:1-aminocyclopropane-1-carboxylate deaminase/D-cysteine desulfhydrase-like pyridoxal-dependent ACC family enzyme